MVWLNEIDQKFISVTLCPEGSGYVAIRCQTSKLIGLRLPGWLQMVSSLVYDVYQSSKLHLEASEMFFMVLTGSLAIAAEHPIQGIQASKNVGDIRVSNNHAKCLS